MSLSAHNVHLFRSGTKILHSVTLPVPAGNVTVLIGPSGAGKTQTLRVLSGLQRPDIGSVRLDGREFWAEDKHLPWPDVTMVFQQLFLWPHLTLRRNILLALSRINENRTPPSLGELAKALDLEQCLDRFPNEVSLGQRQRAALLRALVLEPRYLLLDEVTSALDVEQVERVRATLVRLRNRGTGILLITHLIGFARSIADHVAFIDNGTIVEYGPRSVLSNPSTERVRRFLAVS